MGEIPALALQPYRAYIPLMGYRHVTLPDGTRLNTFDNERDAPVILFIHGNSCDHTFLAPQIEHFAPSRRIIAPDLRGHGESDKPEDGYSFADLSDDLRELLAILNAAPAVAVGHSMGGLLALELAWRHPGLVTAVACLDSTLFTPPRAPKPRPCVAGWPQVAAMAQLLHPLL